MLPSIIERLLLAVYVYHSAGPLSPLQWVRLQIGDLAEHRVELAGVGDAAMLLLELYRRQGQWKVRALEESSAYGLAALGRRSGVSIDESAPGRPAADASAARATAPRYSGTGFAISEDCLLTCAHVIEGARSIAIRSLAGVHPVEPVVVDV